MKKKLYIYLVILFLFTSLFMGCKPKEEKKSEDTSQDLPPLLEQVQEMTDEVVKVTTSKNWGKSLDVIKNLQNKWNDLYPDLKKQSVLQEDVDNFVKDLNTLMDYLIIKTLNLPKQPTGGEQGEASHQMQESGQEQGTESDQQQESGQEKGDEKQQQGQGDSSDSNQQKSSPTDNKKPEEVLKEIDPIIQDKEEDLVIINASIEVTKHIPQFMRLFKSTVPPDLFKMKYFVRHLDVASKMGKWDVVSTDLDNISQTWDSVLPIAIQMDSDLKVQLDQSIKELKDVVASQNANLTGVKSKMILDDLESLVKIVKKKDEEEKKKEKK